VSDRFFILVSTLLFISTGFMANTLFTREQFREKESIELTAEKTGDDLFWQWQNQTLEGIPSGVLGFHIYAPDGQTLFSSGIESPTPPARLQGRGPRPQKTFLPLREGRLALVKTFPRRPAMNHDSHMGNFPGPLTYILLLDTVKVERRIRYFQLGQFLSPLLILALYTMTLIFFVKNRKLRKQLDLHKEDLLASEISSTLSHELKNPLGAIRLQTEILRKTQGESEETRIIDQEVQRMATLLSRMKEFLNNPKGLPQTISISSVLDDIERALPVPLERKEAPSQIEFDPHLLRIVLENIITNGWESQKGLNSQPIRIEGEVEGNYYGLKILDQGKGIPPELKDRVFEPFFTTKVQGSGIGLSLVRKFVLSQGGKVEVNSLAHGPTTVKVLLRRSA